MAQTTQIKKDIKAAALEAQKEQEEFMNVIATWGAALLALIVTIICVILIGIGILHK